MTLKLVSSFSHEAYPHVLPYALEDPDNTSERSQAMAHFRRIAHFGQFEGYRLLEGHAGIQLRLKTETDFNIASLINSCGHKIAEMAFEENFLHAPSRNSDFRKLKNRRNRLQRKINKTDMAGLIELALDRRERAMVVRAQGITSYVKFRRFAESFFPLAEATSGPS